MLITWNKHGPKLFQHSTAWHCHTGQNRWTGQTQEDRLHLWPVFPPVPLEQSQEMLSWSSPVVLEQQRKRLWVRKTKKKEEITFSRSVGPFGSHLSLAVVLENSPVTPGQMSLLGVPSARMTMPSWSMSFSPGNIGDRLVISPKMQPTDHKSTPSV